MINTPKSHTINFQADHLSQQYIIPMVTMIVAGTPAGQSGSAEQSARVEPDVADEAVFT